MKSKLSKLFLITVVSVMCITGCKKAEYVLAKTITFDKTEITLQVGEMEDIIIMVTPDDAVILSLTWESSNTAVAVVDSYGKVMAVGEGTAIITCQSSNKVTASCTVNVIKRVIPVSSVTLDRTTISIEVGSKETLIATVTPENATNQKVIWSSDNTEIATVNDEGEVVAIKEGLATITATTDGGDKIATCEVIVMARKPNDVIKVEIPATRIRIINGMIYYLRDIWWRANPKDVIVNYPTLQGVNTFFGFTDSDGSVLLCEVINYSDFDFVKQWEGEFVHNTSFGTVTEINIQISGVVRIYTDKNGEKIGTMELISLKRTGPAIEEPVLQLGKYTETYPNFIGSRIEFVDNETMMIITDVFGSQIMFKYEIQGNSIICDSSMSMSGLELFFRVIDNSTFEIENFFSSTAELSGWQIMTFERDENQ